MRHREHETVRIPPRALSWHTHAEQRKRSQAPTGRLVHYPNTLPVKAGQASPPTSSRQMRPSTGSSERSSPLSGRPAASRWLPRQRERFLPPAHAAMPCAACPGDVASRRRHGRRRPALHGCSLATSPFAWRFRAAPWRRRRCRGQQTALFARGACWGCPSARLHPTAPLPNRRPTSAGSHAATARSGSAVAAVALRRGGRRACAQPGTVAWLYPWRYPGCPCSGARGPRRQL